MTYKFTESPSLILEHLYYSLRSLGCRMEGGSSIDFPPFIHQISLSSSFRSDIPTMLDPDPKFTNPSANPAHRERHSRPKCLSLVGFFPM